MHPSNFEVYEFWIRNGDENYYSFSVNPQNIKTAPFGQDLLCPIGTCKLCKDQLFMLHARNSCMNFWVNDASSFKFNYVYIVFHHPHPRTLSLSLVGALYFSVTLSPLLSLICFVSLSLICNFTVRCWLLVVGFQINAAAAEAAAVLMLWSQYRWDAKYSNNIWMPLSRFLQIFQPFPVADLAIHAFSLCLSLYHSHSYSISAECKQFVFETENNEEMMFNLVNILHTPLVRIVRYRQYNKSLRYCKSFVVCRWRCPIFCTSIK